MIKKITVMLCLLIGIALVISTSSCQMNNTANDSNAGLFSNNKEPIDYEKYRNVKTYNISINIATNNVLDKTSKIKKKLAEINLLEMESFSADENSANMRAYIPVKDVEKVSTLLSDETEITSFNRSESNIGDSYIEYAKIYYAYKALSDNYDDVIKTIVKKSSYSIDTSKFKKTIEDQVINYKSNMDSYKNQMNRAILQIYISKKTPSNA